MRFGFETKFFRGWEWSEVVCERHDPRLRVQVAGFHLRWVSGVVGSTIVVLDIVSKTVCSAGRLNFCDCVNVMAV